MKVFHFVKDDKSKNDPPFCRFLFVDGPIPTHDNDRCFSRKKHENHLHFIYNKKVKEIIGQ
jgi:hypothetical protein